MHGPKATFIALIYGKTFLIHVHFEVVFPKIQRNFTYFWNLGETWMLKFWKYVVVIVVVGGVGRQWLLCLRDNFIKKCKMNYFVHFSIYHLHPCLIVTTESVINQNNQWVSPSLTLPPTTYPDSVAATGSHWRSHFGLYISIDHLLPGTYRGHMPKFWLESQKLKEILRFENFEITRFFPFFDTQKSS